MLRKAKRLPVIAMLVLTTMFLGSLSGCGDSADPLRTGIIQFYDVSTGVIITSTTTQTGGSVTLVVRVLNLRSDGTTWVPIIGEKVTFTLLTPGNGGGLTVVNDRTAGNGQAMAVFTAGNNSATDSVRATTGSGATASITITKTGGIVGARISTLVASATTVAGYQTSTVTATVTDGNSPANPILGEPVTFTIPMNQSDACFITASLACVDTVTVNSDASGHAVALYRGGAYNPYYDVSDTVRAALANGSSNALVIIRSAATPPVPLSIAVTATPEGPLTAGQASVITATLSGDDKVGVLVTFSLPVNNSGASLSASSAVTDGNGNAVVTYVAGGSNATEDVSDSVQASVGSISGSVAITRSGTGATALSISVAASPASVGAGQVSIVTATLTGTNVAGVTVNFSLTTTIGSTLSSTTAVTDGSGRAVVTYTAGLTNPTQNITDTVRATSGSAASAVAITRTGSAVTPGYVVTVTAVPSTLTADNANSIITANVKNDGTAVIGQVVTFTVTGTAPTGTFPGAAPWTATTDASGNAVNTFTGGGAHPTGETNVVTATITVGAANYSGNVIITYP